jgi:hypothetical protein
MKKRLLQARNEPSKRRRSPTLKKMRKMRETTKS